MTDGRIPGKWMSEPRFVEMSVDTWCVLTKAIAWSNEAGTDGLIKRRYLALLHPDGEQPAAYDELVRMGLWSATGDGFQFVGWSVKAHQGGLGQSTAEQVRADKERKRENQRDYRRRQAEQAALTSVGGDVTGDVTDSVPGDVGQDNSRHASTAGDHLRSAHAREEQPPPPSEPTDDGEAYGLVDSGTGEVEGWAVAPIGQGAQSAAESSVFDPSRPYGGPFESSPIEATA